MKPRTWTQVVVLAGASILLFGIGSVNHSSLPISERGPVLVADGVPLPPPEPLPPKQISGLSVMDGVPLPPPEPLPPKNFSSHPLTDGVPLPPPEPLPPGHGISQTQSDVRSNA